MASCEVCLEIIAARCRRLSSLRMTSRLRLGAYVRIAAAPVDPSAEVAIDCDGVVTVDASGNGADFDVLAVASAAATSASPASAGSGAGVLLECPAPVVAAGSASVSVAACVRGDGAGV